MYICVFVCIFIYLYVCLNMFVHLYVYLCICVYLYLYLCILLYFFVGPRTQLFQKRSSPKTTSGPGPALGHTASDN